MLRFRLSCLRYCVALWAPRSFHDWAGAAPVRCLTVGRIHCANTFPYLWFWELFITPPKQLRRSCDLHLHKESGPGMRSPCPGYVGVPECCLLWLWTRVLGQSVYCLYPSIEPVKTARPLRLPASSLIFLPFLIISLTPPLLQLVLRCSRCSATLIAAAAHFLCVFLYFTLRIRGFVVFCQRCGFLYLSFACVRKRSLLPVPVQVRMCYNIFK